MSKEKTAKPLRTDIECPSCGRLVSMLTSNHEAYCWGCGNVCRGEALERAKERVQKKGCYG